MKLAREKKVIPEYKSQIDLPRFIWSFTTDYQEQIRKRNVNDAFWARQKLALQDFDQKNPGHFRPAGIQPAENRPKFQILKPQYPVMVAGGSKRPPAKRQLPPPVPLPHRSPAPSPKLVSTLQTQQPATKPSLAQRSQQTINPEPAEKPISSKNKGKNKYVEISEEEASEKLSGDSDSDIGGYTEPASKPAPGPSRHDKPVSKRQPFGQVKEKGMVPEEVQDRPSAPQVDKKRASPKPTGSLRDPPCVRCSKSGRKCQEQAGVGKACVFCAKVKMKCIVEDDDEDQDPKAGKVRVMNPAPALAPAQVKLKQPMPSTKPVVEDDDKDQDPKAGKVRVTNPAPAPAPAQVKSKQPVSSTKPGPSQKPARNPAPAPARVRTSKRKPAKTTGPAPTRSEAAKPPPAKKQKVESKPANDNFGMMSTGDREIRRPKKGTFIDVQTADGKITTNRCLNGNLTFLLY